MASATGPKVRTTTLRRILASHLAQPDETVAGLAERSEVSIRTINRILEPDRPECDLYIADKILTSLGEHLSVLGEDLPNE